MQLIERLLPSMRGSLVIGAPKVCHWCGSSRLRPKQIAKQLYTHWVKECCDCAEWNISGKVPANEIIWFFGIVRLDGRLEFGCRGIGTYIDASTPREEIVLLSTQIVAWVYSDPDMAGVEIIGGKEAVIDALLAVRGVFSNGADQVPAANSKEDQLKLFN